MQYCITCIVIAQQSELNNTCFCFFSLSFFLKKFFFFFFFFFYSFGKWINYLSYVVDNTFVLFNCSFCSWTVKTFSFLVLFKKIFLTVCLHNQQLFLLKYSFKLVKEYWYCIINAPLLFEYLNFPLKYSKIYYKFKFIRQIFMAEKINCNSLNIMILRKIK